MVVMKEGAPQARCHGRTARQFLRLDTVKGLDSQTAAAPIERLRADMAAVVSWRELWQTCC